MGKDTKPVKRTAKRAGNPPVETRFKPGNPGGGRPKMPEDVKLAFRSLTMDAVKTLASIMQSGDSDTSRLRAAEIILNRAWGTPTQAVDLTRGEGLPLEVVVRYVD